MTRCQGSILCKQAAVAFVAQCKGPIWCFKRLLLKISTYNKEIHAKKTWIVHLSCCPGPACAGWRSFWTWLFQECQFSGPPSHTVDLPVDPYSSDIEDGGLNHWVWQGTRKLEFPKVTGRRAKWVDIKSFLCEEPFILKIDFNNRVNIRVEYYQKVEKNK